MAMTKAVARVVMVPMYDAADTTILKSGLAPTCVVSKDGGGFVATTTPAAEIGASGVYAITLTAAEMDADFISLKATAPGACDQVLTVVTDELASMKAKTDTIGALAVTVSSPVAADGTISLEQGDSYPASKSRSIPVAISDPTHALDLDAENVTVYLRAFEFTWTAASVTSTDDGYTLEFEPTIAQTEVLTGTRQSYKILASYDEVEPTPDDATTIQRGRLVLNLDIPAVS